MIILLFGFFAIPKDQKKNIALSSHGIAVCKKPKVNAGMKIIKNSWTIFINSSIGLLDFQFKI